MDGNHLTFSETIERNAIVVSLQQNDEKGRIATVRIDAATFEELCRLDSAFDGLKIEASVAAPLPGQPPVVEG